MLSKHKRLRSCQWQSEGLARGCRQLLQRLKVSTATALGSGWKTSTETCSGKKKAVSQPRLRQQPSLGVTA